MRALALLVCLVLGSFSAFAESEAELTRNFGLSSEDSNRAIGWAHKIRKEIESDGLYAVAVRTDAALDRLVQVASQKLTEKGDGEYAYFKESEWKRDYSGFLTKQMNSRHIGDHPTEMLSQWLENFYDHVELVLGVSLCKALHLSDIKTINCCTKVVFKPCSFEMDGLQVERVDEYRNHFAKDDGADELYGEVPVITFWAVEIFVSVPFVAGAAEYVMGKYLAPRLSDMVFKLVCQ